MKNLNTLRDIDALQIKLASSDDIREWSYGEITKPETINYRTFKPENDGLFCQKIFGPVKDYECACGKYKRIRYKGVVCDRCGVAVTSSKVRRERMGHIELSSPVAHVWFFKNIPSVLATLLSIAPRSLELVVYFSSFIVVDIDQDAKKKTLEGFEDLIEKARDKALAKTESDINAVLEEAEGKVASLSKDPEDKWSDDLKGKAAEIRSKAQDKVLNFRSKESIEQDRAAIEIKKIKKKLEEVELHKVMTDIEFMLLEEYLDEFCEMAIGAEAIERILKELDLEAIRTKLQKDIDDGKAAKNEKILKRMKVVDSFIKGKVNPTSIIFHVLPVIPPELRPMVMLQGGRFATSDLNDLYRRIINRNNRLKRLLDLGAPEIIVRNEKRMLQEAVDALFDSSKVRTTITRERKTYRSLADQIKGKQGHFRANLLGKRVDYSGRAVIVSGPHLKMHECGLPTDMALELFRPFLLREIMKRGLAPNMKTAKYILEDRPAEVYEILEELVKQRPVLLNRAPTLHKLSIQAFYPRLTDSKAIQLHPVVCSGFNADFDGDQMAVHLPLGKEAVEEAEKLMLSTRNMLKPADGSVQTNPSHEMILGLFYLTSINDKLEPAKTIFAEFDQVQKALNNGVIDLRQKIKVDHNGEILETTAGRIILNTVLPEELGFVNIALSKSQVSKLIKRSLTTIGIDRTVLIIDAFKTFGFKYSTYSGVSLSIFDCMEPTDLAESMDGAHSEIDQIEANFQMGLITDTEMNKLSQKVWMGLADHFDKTILSGTDSQNPVNIVISASAGKASSLQMRQISAIKGLVTDPSGQQINMPILGNYSRGMSSFDYYLTARAVRKSYMDKGLGTADAGYLTRRLVNVAQDVMIREEDCGTTEGRMIVRGDNTTLVKWYERSIGRTSLEDIKDGNKILVKAGEIITRPIAEQIESVEKITHIKVRSPMHCHTMYGICSKCYGIDLSVNEPVKVGAAVGIIAAQSIGEPGTQLTMNSFHKGGVAGENITQGLPRVEELFEVRKPKKAALISTLAGKIDIVREEDSYRIVVKPSSKLEEIQSFVIDKGEELLIKDGDVVEVGTQLTAGPINLQDLYAIAGASKAQNYILDQIQKVYGAQGVDINDKHVEIIVRQMFNRVKITKSHGSDLLPGDVISRYRLSRANQLAKKAKEKPYEFDTVLVGISKASRMAESWLDAASFEETAAVLTESAIAGAIDELIGLKENVIIGRQIPVGERARLENIVKNQN